MDLRERLRMLKAAGATRPTPPAPERAAYSHGDLRPAPTPGGLDGYMTATPEGEAFYVQTEYPVEYCRGPLPLEQIGTIPAGAWELLGRVRGFDPLRAVYLDTETTGLGGMGTYLFLIGLGFFEGHTFVVRQYFMRDYPEEGAVLEAVHRDLTRFDAIVTFNGRTFDWPLMEGRLLLHRKRPPLSGAPHLDLLHPARRLWKERLGSCTLGNLEAQVLGVQRHGDVPGALIPGLYFQYLRTGDAAPLAPVLLHNRADIVSLVSLAGWMGHMVSNPLHHTPDGELLCGDDLFALARLFAARGLHAEALLCMETALERGVEQIGEVRALGVLSQAYKRLRRHDRAVAVWQQMIAAEPNLSVFPLIELAKFYEHVVKEPAAALSYARKGLEVAMRRRSLAGTYGPAAAREVAEIQHRLRRLEQKASL